MTHPSRRFARQKPGYQCLSQQQTCGQGQSMVLIWHSAHAIRYLPWPSAAAFLFRICAHQPCAGAMAIVICLLQICSTAATSPCVCGG